jgi:hypothetical protein
MLQSERGFQDSCKACCTFSVPHNSLDAANEKRDVFVASAVGENRTNGLSFDQITYRRSGAMRFKVLRVITGFTSIETCSFVTDIDKFGLCLSTRARILS